MTKFNFHSIIQIIFVPILLGLGIYFGYSISQECIPSVCGVDFCTADCGGKRSYLFPIIMVLLSITFGIIGTKNLKRK